MTNSHENSKSKTGLIIGAAIAVAVVGAAALYLVDLDQTQEAQLPTVSVDVEEGQLPAYDVDVADVNVGTTDVDVAVPSMDVETKTIEIEVPVDADVNMEDETVSMPTISVDQPAEDDPADQPQ